MPPPGDELRGQARVLAEPILNGIADRPPDYEESFRDADSGWPGGSTAAGDEWGYQDGAYVISATYLPQGECCIGAGPEPEVLLSDFVLELEAQFLSGEGGLWGVTFRESAGTETPGDHYALGFWPDGNFRVWKNIGGAHIELKETDESLPAFESGYEPNRLTVIAQGPQLAFYMNGEPLWYVYDESVSEGGLQLMAENLEPDTLLQVRYEDLKVWDISEPAVPSAEATPTPPPPPAEALQVHKLMGHTGLVESVSWSPDGTTLASGGGVDDNTVTLWDTSTGERLRTLVGHTAEVDVVEWSPDGTMLASGSGDNTVILWDTETGEVRRTLVGHTSLVDDLAFSPDGGTLAAGGNDGRVILWDVETGERLRDLVGHTDQVQGVEWSPDGALLATGGYDHLVIVWNPETGERLRTLEGHTDWVRGLAWSPVAPKLTSGSYHDGTLIVWNRETGERRHTLEGLGKRVSVKWSPDGALLATGLGDGRVMVWDAETFERLLTFGGQIGVVESLAWSPDGTQLASGAYDHTVIVWEIPR
jgi:WD40 repeat protein